MPNQIWERMKNNKFRFKIFLEKQMKNIEDEKKVAIERFNLFIKQKKMRQTSERVFILDKIYSISSFFDAQTLYEQINQEMHISLATIYSTLNLLQECNLIIRHNFNTNNIKYEKLPIGKAINYYYRVCVKCNTVKAFADSKLSRSISLRKSNAFSTFNHTLYLYGICKKCKENNQ